MNFFKKFEIAHNFPPNKFHFIFSFHRCIISNIHARLITMQTISTLSFSLHSFTVKPISTSIVHKPKQLVTESQITLSCEVEGSVPDTEIKWTQNNRLFERGTVSMRKKIVETFLFESRWVFLCVSLAFGKFDAITIANAEVVSLCSSVWMVSALNCEVDKWSAYLKRVARVTSWWDVRWTSFSDWNLNYLVTIY